MRAGRLLEVLCVLALGCVGVSAQSHRSFALEAISPNFWTLIDHDAQLETFASGFGFTEGPMWDYEDGLEHSLWLTLLRDRLELLRRLLAEDGSLWMTIDDNEAHYLKVLCDEVFGRQNFVANVVWQKKFSPQANAVWLSDSHDHVLVFAKQKEIWRPNLLERSESADSRYDNPDNDPRGAWTSGDFTISLTGGQRGAQFARTGACRRSRASCVLVGMASSLIHCRPLRK